MGRSPSRLALLLIPFVLACFAFLPRAQAVVPPPDGGYPGLNTAEGTKALSKPHHRLCQHRSWLVFARKQHHRQLQHRFGAGTLLLNTADDNTATGAAALLINTTGSTTRPMASALFNNTTG